MITSITIDLNYTQHPYSANFYKMPVIIIQRGGYWHGTTTIYKATGTALQWAARYIARNGGAVKVNNENSATWFHNVSSMYTNGYVFESEFVTLAVLPNWNLKITLNDAGLWYANDLLDFPDSDVKRYFWGMNWETASEEEKQSARYSYRSGSIMNTLEYELLETALCNGLTLDPNDDGRNFISFDAGIDNNGNFDVSPGDLGWDDPAYAIRSYVDALLLKGHVIFTPYYFGETSLDDQRSI